MKRKKDSVDVATSICIATYYQLVTIVGTAIITDMSREQSPPYQKYKWGNFLERHGNNPQFMQRYLRMTLKSFYKLLSYVCLAL